MQIDETKLDAARAKLPSMIANVDTALTMLVKLIGSAADLDQVKRSREFRFACSSLRVLHESLCSSGGVKSRDNFILEDAEMR